MTTKAIDKAMQKIADGHLKNFARQLDAGNLENSEAMRGVVEEIKIYLTIKQKEIFEVLLRQLERLRGEK